MKTGYDSGSLGGQKGPQSLNIAPSFDFMRFPVMTPSQRARRGCQASRDPKWRAAGEQLKLLLRYRLKNKTLDIQGCSNIKGMQ